jgi:hypothetical protein
MRANWRTLALVVAVGTVALALRVWFATSRHTGLDSDEAIVGLMAVRMLRHGELPGAFYWGQSYGGSEKRGIRLFERSLREQHVPYRVIRKGWFMAVLPDR